MKTKVFKAILPLFAMVMAVGMAFATKSFDTNRPGYILTPTGPMEVPGGVYCDTQVNAPCLYLGQQVFADKEGNIPLFIKE